MAQDCRVSPLPWDSLPASMSTPESPLTSSLPRRRGRGKREGKRGWLDVVQNPQPIPFVNGRALWHD